MGEWRPSGEIRHLFKELATMRKLFLSLAALALVVGPALAGQYNKVISVGQKAPAISGIPAVLGDKDMTLDLNSIKEDVVVVVFLANHCPVVTATEDRLIDLANKYKDRGVKFVGICVDQRPEDRLPAIKQRVKEKNYPFIYGYDESQKVGKAYGATNTPQVFVLDKDRVIRYTGLIDDNHNNEAKVTKTYLKDAIEAVLKGETVEVPETKPFGCGIPYTK
jgi:peroxiredoxin